MNPRPVAVTIIGLLLAIVGVAGFAFHFYQLGPQHAFNVANVWIFLVELVALACGVFLLRGANWARWLAMAWMASHVAFSFFDSLQKAAVHGLIFLLLAYFLFRPQANAYFRRREAARN